jgi:hypothetical protein
MPLPVDSINSEMKLPKVRQLVNETIQMLIHKENKDPKEAAGQAYGMAAEKWGKKIPKGG